MKTILTIFKKELKRVFTDRRMLVSLILPGVLLYVVYSMIGFLLDMSTNDEDVTYRLYTVNAPAEFEMFANKDYSGMSIEVTEITAADIDDVKTKISGGKADLLMVYDADFLTKVNAYDSSSGNVAPAIGIYYNSTEENSVAMYSYYIAVLDAYESALTNKFDVNGGGAQYDLASSESISKKIVSSILPYLIVIMLFSGCMTMASDSIAGEKERGTLATMLVSPVKRSYLAIGKVAALSVSSLIPALSSLLGMMLALPKLMSGMELDISVYGFSTYAQLFLVVVLLELILNAILAIVSTLAKSVKEAQSYSVPLMMIVLLAAMGNMLGLGFSNDWTAYFIPIYSLIYALTAIFESTITAMQLLVAAVINLAVFALGAFALGKMFGNERIMFNK